LIEWVQQMWVVCCRKKRSVVSSMRNGVLARLKCILAITFVASVVLGCRPEYRPTGPNPSVGKSIEFAQSTIQLGEGVPNQVMKGEVSLRNVGLEPVSIQLSASCTCVDLSPRSCELKAGASTNVQFSVRLPGNRGSSRSIQIVAQVDGRPISSCIAHATCPELYRLVPETIDFGVLDAAAVTDIEREVVIEKLSGDSFAQDLLLRTNGSHPIFKSDASVRPDGRLSVRVRLVAESRIGQYFDTVSVVDSDSEHGLLSVPVRANIAPRVSAIPSTLFVARPAEPTGLSTATIHVTWRQEKDAPGNFEGIEGPAGIFLRGDFESGIRRRRIEVGFDRTFSAYGQLMKLRFAELAEPLVVTLKQSE
jgi:hypothetical protein